MQLELQGLQVVRVQEDRVVHRGPWEILVLLVVLDSQVSLVGLDCRDLWGSLVLLGSLEHQASLVHQGRQVKQVTLACRDRWEKQVQLGQQVCPGALEVLVPLVILVLLELLAYQEAMANQESQEIQVHRDLLEKWE